MSAFTNIVKVCTQLAVVFGLAILLPSFPADAATFTFTPTSRDFVQGPGCRTAIDIYANAAGENSNAADIELYYNPTEITIIDSQPEINGVQIKPGNAYETYFGNIVDPTTGKIVLAGASFVGALNSNKVFATIEFTPKSSVTKTSFTIKFDGVGATLDSNIADAATSDDLLVGVTNGTYTFSSGTCIVDRDTIAPTITFINPKNLQRDVPADSTVTIQIRDDKSGVDLSTVIFDINGELYTVDSPEVRYSGVPLDYTFVITPRADFLPSDFNVVKATAKDLAGNQASGQIVFLIPVVPTEPTPCNCEDPDPVPTTPNNTLVTPLSSILGGNPVINIFDITRNVDSSRTVLEGTSVFSLATLLFGLLGSLLVSQRKRLVTGFARDFVTDQPLAEKKAYLFDLVSRKMTEEVETLEDGEYDIKLYPGTYELKIRDDHTDWFETIIVPERDSYKFYDDHMKAIQEEKKTGFMKFVSKVYYFLVDVVPRLIGRLIFNTYISRLSSGVLFVGMVIAIIGVVVYSSWVNILIFATYTSFYGVFYLLPGIIGFFSRPIYLTLEDFENETRHLAKDHPDHRRKRLG